MNSKPLVSVVLPTYNGGAYIAKAVESVMRQTYRNFELLVVDDGSSDETPEILKELGRRYAKLAIITHQENSGFVKTLNDGVKSVQGVYVARIDDDDVWRDEQKLEKQVAFLKKHPEYGMVGTGIIQVTPEGREIGRYLFVEHDKDIRKMILADNAFAHSTVMFKKELWEQAGGYQEKFHFFADWGLWLAIGRIAKFYNFLEYSTLYLEKEQGGNYGRRNTQIRRKIKAHIQLALQHRRDYPGFWKALFLAFAKYGYSYIPFRHLIRPILYRLRIFLFRSPILAKRSSHADKNNIASFNSFLCTCCEKNSSLCNIFT